VIARAIRLKMDFPISILKVYCFSGTLDSK